MNNYTIETTGSNILISNVIKEDENYLFGRIKGIGYNVPKSKFNIDDIVLISKKNSYPIQLGNETLYFINHCSIFCKLNKKVEVPQPFDEFKGLVADF